MLLIQAEDWERWTDFDPSEVSDFPRWIRGKATQSTPDGPKESDAMLRGGIAVHRMLGGMNGWCISLTKTGYRLACGGLVFSSQRSAMVFVDEMFDAIPDWVSVDDACAPHAKDMFIHLHDKGRAEGIFLKDLVYVA